uniref:Uncharacterized protein n=1 Tax=Caenorhabditis tropicalis TaxID=1561998 RepID=A0A1I7UGE2_9PELO
MGLWDDIWNKGKSFVNNVFYSKEQNEAWYKTEHAEELATHNRNLHEKKTRKEKEIREEYERVIAKEETKMKAELKTLVEGSNMRTRKEMDEYVKFKKQREADFELWKKNMETKYLSSGFDDKAVFLGMNGLEEQKEKMEKGEKEMKELGAEWKKMNQNSIDYNNNLFAQRYQMRSDCDQRIIGRMTEYHGRMLELVEEGEARKLAAEVVLKGMAERHRENELGFLDRQWEIEYWNVISRKELMKAVTSEEKHEEFRFECQNLVIEFNRFKASYYKEQPAFLQILKALKEKKTFDMHQGGNLLSGLPRFMEALGSLDIVDKGVIPVKNQVDGLIKNLNYNFSQLTEVVRAYKPGRHEKDNSHETALDYYNIIDSLVKELSEVMLGFNLKPSDAYEIEFEKQWNALMPSIYSIEGTRQHGIKTIEPRVRFGARGFDGTTRWSRGIQEIEGEEDLEVDVGLGLGLPKLSRLSAPTLPVFGGSVTVPSIGVMVPSIGVTVPSIGGNLPSLAGTVPSIGATLPSIGVTAPGIGATLPSIGGTLPSIGGTLPGIGGTLPSIGTTLPSIGVTAPGVGGTLPSIGGNLPSIGTTLPSVGATFPVIGGNLPSLRGTLPCIGVTSPSIGGTLPSIGALSPNFGARPKPSDNMNNNVRRLPGNIQKPVTTKDWLESIVAQNSGSQKVVRETPILNGNHQFSSPISNRLTGNQRPVDYGFREIDDQEPEEYVFIEDERQYEYETREEEKPGQQVQRTIHIKDTDQMSVQGSTFSDRVLRTEDSGTRHYENRKPKSINSSNNSYVEVDQQQNKTHLGQSALGFSSEEVQISQENRMKGIGSSDVQNQQEVLSSRQSVVSSIFQAGQIETGKTRRRSEESRVEMSEKRKSQYSENGGSDAMHQAPHDFKENSRPQKKRKTRVQKPSQEVEVNYPGGQSGTRRPDVASVTMTTSRSTLDLDKKPVFIGNEGPEALKESLVHPNRQQSRVQVPTQNVRSSPDDRTAIGLSSRETITAQVNRETTPTPKSSKPMEPENSKSRQAETPLLQKVAQNLKKEFEDVEENIIAHSSHAPEKREVVIGNRGPEAFKESLVLPKKQRSRVQASTQNGKDSSDERPANRVPPKESTRLPEIDQKAAGNDQKARVVNSERLSHQGVGGTAMRHIEEYIEGISTGKAPSEPTKPSRNSKIVLKSYKKLGIQNEPGSPEPRVENHSTQSSVALKKYVSLHKDPPEELILAGKPSATAISNPVNLRDQLNNEIRNRSLKNPIKHVANGISHVAPVKSLVKQGSKLLSPLKPVIRNLEKDIKEVKMIPKRISRNHGLQMPRGKNPSTYMKPVINNLENKLAGVEKKILETTEFSSFLPANSHTPRGPATYIKNHYKSPALPHPYHLTFWLKKEKAESQK